MPFQKKECQCNTEEAPLFQSKHCGAIGLVNTGHTMDISHRPYAAEVYVGLPFVICQNHEIQYMVFVKHTRKWQNMWTFITQLHCINAVEECKAALTC